MAYLLIFIPFAVTVHRPQNPTHTRDTGAAHASKRQLRKDADI